MRDRRTKHSFSALIAAQFFGALNDNLFKTVVALSVLQDVVEDKNSILYLALTGALFVCPYIFFSAHAGYLSDKFSKSSVVRAVKFLEILVMGIAFIGFSYQSISILLTAVFLMGFQSALFSPSKYGIIPELVEEEDLSRANGYLEFWTFSGIILGTAGAGIVLSSGITNPGYVTLALAIVGFLISLLIKNLSAKRSDLTFPLNPVGPHFHFLRQAKASRGLFLSIIGIAFFWSSGQLFQLNILLYAKQTLVLGDTKTSIILALIGLGIGLGSIFAGRTSEGKVELGLVPIGAVGIAVTNLIIPLASGSLAWSYLLVFILGLSGGIFIVPVQSYLQEYTPEDERGSYIAASNFLTFTIMLFVSFLFWFLTDYLALSAKFVFLFCGLLTIGVSFYLVKILPDMLTRCLNWMLLHCLYKMTKIGRENIPEEGGALIVCNHVSYADAQILLASLKRPIRFLMYKPFYELTLINPLVSAVGTIPISNEDGRKGIVEALQTARQAVIDGEIVGIFAEGGITRTGEMTQFKKGFETIMRDLDEPIIPAYLDGLWGSILSYADGKVFWKWPKKFPYPVKIVFGVPLPGSSSATEVQEAVEKLKESSSDG